MRSGGEVADVRNAVEREEVVLAERAERDVPYQYQLVVGLVIRKRREVERLGVQQLGIGVSHTSRRSGQVLGVGIATEGDEQVTYCPLGGIEIDGVVLGDHAKSAVIAVVGDPDRPRLARSMSRQASLGALTGCI